MNAKENVVMAVLFRLSVIHSCLLSCIALDSKE